LHGPAVRFDPDLPEWGSGVTYRDVFKAVLALGLLVTVQSAERLVVNGDEQDAQLSCAVVVSGASGIAASAQGNSAVTSMVSLVGRARASTRGIRRPVPLGLEHGTFSNLTACSVACEQPAPSDGLQLAGRPKAPLARRI